MLCDDTQTCILLPDSNANDVRDLIAASLSHDDSLYVDIDASFTDKFYWCDIDKLLTKKFKAERQKISVKIEERHKVDKERRKVVKGREESPQHKLSRKR